MMLVDTAGRKRSPAVLFVCTANICRSPMAEALFRAHLQTNRADWADWRIESAGTWAHDGEPVSEYSRESLAKRGILLKNHLSKTITPEMIEQFDLILVMESGHKEALQVEFPRAGGKIFLLSEMQDQLLPVQDPYGGSLETYEKAAATIEAMIIKGFDRIVTLAQKHQF
jgi:protein-tyrosine-phosphatase